VWIDVDSAVTGYSHRRHSFQAANLLRSAKMAATHCWMSCAVDAPVLQSPTTEKS
jgi:hypothetical protein